MSEAVAIKDVPIGFGLNATPITDEQERRWEWKNVIIPHIIASRLPVRYHRRVALSQRQKAVFNQCRDLCKHVGAIIALIGPRGLGKTEIAAQLIIARAEQELPSPWHRRPPYRKMTDLIALFKPIYSDFGSIHTDELVTRRNNFCADHPLVVIDEVHDCEDQKVKDRLLTDILDRRYANLNDTVLISNQTLKEFAEQTNPSTLSRLEEHGRIIECNWSSFRRKSAPGSGA